MELQNQVPDPEHKHHAQSLSSFLILWVMLAFVVGCLVGYSFYMAKVMPVSMSSLQIALR